MQSFSTDWLFPVVEIQVQKLKSIADRSLTKARKCFWDSFFDGRCKAIILLFLQIRWSNQSIKSS